VKKFQTDKSVKCAVVQQSAGAEGWDGSVANIAIFFDGIGSPKTRKQCAGRIHRKGQTESCLVIDLVLKHSIDGRVLKNRSERFNFVKEVMDYIQEYGGVETV
jgi:SNF2 family DNA or RNA helicase